MVVEDESEAEIKEEGVWKRLEKMKKTKWVWNLGIWESFEGLDEEERIEFYEINGTESENLRRIA